MPRHLLRHLPSFEANYEGCFVLHVSANVSDDHEHEDDCDIQALVDFTKVQEQIINMYTTLCEEKKDSASKEDVDETEIVDNEETVKVRSSPPPSPSPPSQ